MDKAIKTNVLIVNCFPSVLTLILMPSIDYCLAFTFSFLNNYVGRSAQKEKISLYEYLINSQYYTLLYRRLISCYTFICTKLSVDKTENFK